MRVGIEAGIPPGSPISPLLANVALRALDEAWAVIPGGNTNAPTIMIAERAADLIRGRVPESATAQQGGPELPKLA